MHTSNDITAYSPRPLHPFGVIIDVSERPRNLDEIPIEHLRTLARAHHVVLLRGFSSPTADELTKHCQGWGELLRWPFGHILDVVEQEDSHDHVFHSGYLPLHWDGMYVDYIPEFQFFQCVTAPPGDAGGETLFCDTRLVWRNADQATRERWRRISATYRIKRITHYGGRVTSPLVIEHARTGEPILRFNEPSPDRARRANGHAVEVTGIDGAADADTVASLIAALHDPRHMLAHAWRRGDLLIADNYTLLHGRKPYRSGAPRHLRRVHILGSPPHENPAQRGVG